MTSDPRSMGRPKKEPRTTSIRLTDECAKWSRIAAAYHGESITDYVSRTLTPIAEAEAKRMAEAENQPKPSPPDPPPGPAPKARKKGKGGRADG